MFTLSDSRFELLSSPDLVHSPHRERMARRSENPVVRPIADALRRRVIGQEPALERLVAGLSRLTAGLSDPHRPPLSALLMGPTGVGKTETAKALAKALFGSDQALTRIDCEEYAHGHEIAKLLGSPPGYVGHNVEPLLTQRRIDTPHRRYLESAAGAGRIGGSVVESLLPEPTATPFLGGESMSSSPTVAGARKELVSIVLFDEIEKAHPRLWDALLGVLDDGVLTLGDNSTTSFKRSIILLTSNIGSRSIGELLEPSGLGFSPSSASTEVASERVQELALDSARRSFSPEFLNRLDAQLAYSPLGPEELSKILERMIGDLQQRILDHSRVPLLLKLSDAARHWLVEHGTDVRYGARPLRRALERELIDPLSDFISAGDVVDGDVVEIDLEQDRLEFFRSARHDQGIVA